MSSTSYLVQLTLKYIRNEAQSLWLAQREHKSSEVAVDGIAASELIRYTHILRPVHPRLEASMVGEVLKHMSSQGIVHAEAMGVIPRDIQSI
jgi:hypothetical protein